MAVKGKLLLGNEAVAQGAYEAGADVVSSYPGTPSTEVTENIAKYSAEEIYCEWAPNEKVAAEVAIGASVAGSRAMCCMKHVGLNVAADPLFTAAYTGVNGGLVFLVADDPGMFSSQNEQDTRFYGLSSHIPVLEPSDSQECLDYTKLAFELSETFDTPVIVRLTTRIAHQRSLVTTGERVKTAKAYTKQIPKYVMVPAMAKARHVFVEQRMADLKAAACGVGETEKVALVPNRVEMNDRKLGIVTSGVCYQYAKEVFPEASILKLGMVHPMPDDVIKKFAAEVEELIVIEELEPFIENHIKQMGIKVEGKKYFTNLGELGTVAIRKAYYGTEPECETLGEEVNVPARPPVFCAGCPHRAVFHVLAGLKVRVCGDIGCYSLGAMAPYNGLDSVVCMGASVSMAHGMQKAMEINGELTQDKVVAVIGDSTFMHSGITSLVDVAYNKGVSTTIILDNSITGMTGHQQNPAMGYTIRNEKTVAVDLVKLCDAMGIRRVRVVDPFDMKALKAAIVEETAADEPSVIISQRPCALLKSVNYGAPVKIDQDKCVKCGSCMRLGCPAINKVDGKYVIDASQCAGCELCTSMCPKGAISK